MKPTFSRLRQRANALRSEIQALYLAFHDPRTPWYAKWLAVGIVAYAFSPIDLIPDFIPVLGHLDDLILLPMGIALAIRLVPGPVLADCREQARNAPQNNKPGRRAAGVIVVLVWVCMTVFAIAWAYRAIMAAS